MAISYSGAKDRKDLAEIQEYLYQDALTIQDGVIDIQPGFKSGANVYESKVGVTMKAGSSDAVAADGSITMAVQRTPVALTLIEYSDTFDEESLKGTRFEESMAPGAINNISDEFDKKVLAQVIPAMGEDVDAKIWNGATAATKVAIAALVPGAGQGSISAGAQALVAAMPVTLFNSIPVRLLYNDSLSKVAPGAGLGDYVKVAGTTITAANIDAEYAKIYAGIPSKVLNKRGTLKYVFAPLTDVQLIVAANKLATVSQQMPFVVENQGTVTEKITYNGIEIKFYPLVGFRIAGFPKHLKVLNDFSGDLSSLEIDKMANGAKSRYLKNQQMMTTWVTNQDLNVLYNG